MSDSNTGVDASMETWDTEQARVAIAEAITKRAVPLQPAEEEEERRFALERDTRQEFRRLLDPGIVRGAYPATLEGTLKVCASSLTVISGKSHTNVRCFPQ
jgi:beta-glucosidase/6-phospho-beta-glucosidase/beta-galactosidase